MGFIAISFGDLGASYPAGSNPWNAQPLNVAPAGLYFTPNTKPAAEEFNYLFGNLIANQQVMRQMTQQVLTGSGNWTCPAGVYQVSLDMTGGGGGGGGGGGANTSTNKSACAGSGGSGGARYLQVFPTIPGNVYAYVCGPGGAGGTAGSAGNGGNGADGTDTTFGVGGATAAAGCGGQGGPWTGGGSSNLWGTTSIACINPGAAGVHSLSGTIPQASAFTGAYGTALSQGFPVLALVPGCGGAGTATLTGAPISYAGMDSFWAEGGAAGSPGTSGSTHGGGGAGGGGGGGGGGVGGGGIGGTGGTGGAGNDSGAGGNGTGGTNGTAQSGAGGGGGGGGGCGSASGGAGGAGGNGGGGTIILYY